MTSDESDRLQHQPRGSGVTQAVTVIAVVAITLGTVGLLLLSRSTHNVAHQGPVSGTRLASPAASPTTVPPDAYVRLSAPSGKVVWALVGLIVLFRSTDSGNTWEQRSLPASIVNVWFEMSFVDDRQGWLLPHAPCSYSGAAIWHTTDGALTWQEVAIRTWKPSYASENASQQCRQQGLSFVDPTHGFISAWVPGRKPTIYLTRDGGKNWTGADLPDPPDYTTTLAFPKYSLGPSSVKRFGKSMYVFAWGTQPGDFTERRYIFRSTDGGGSWSWMAKVPPRDVVMVTESRWLQLNAPGDSMQSTDSGQQWNIYPSDFNAGNSVVAFGDAHVGYANGDGAILRTLDGGLNWDKIPAPGLPKIDLLPVTDPGFTCRLAVGSGAFGNSPNGGFVAVPRGRFEFDPAATMVRVAGQRWDHETAAQPALKGTGGISFDASFSRWLPAYPAVVSSDGSQYAWTEREMASADASGARIAPAPNRLHLTNVADGTDRSFAVDKPPGKDHFGPIPVPIGITKAGVLLTYGWEGSWGVWRLDLASGSLIKVTGLPSPNYGAGAIWVTPTRGPNYVGMYSDGDTLARLDLASGAVVDWFHRDNFAVGYLGVDGTGNPWVETIRRQTPKWVVEIWRVRGPGQADLILSGQLANRVITDSHGTWFGNETGVYLYADGRVQRVSSASVGEVVGPCV
jgi:photosystem II stability/assembly factor-like uncharacterized protein